MSTDHDQTAARLIPPPERRSNRTAWTVVIVVALVALLAAVIFYAKQSRDREDQQLKEYACTLDVSGPCCQVTSDGRCVTS
jgi:hypothetical protein